MQCPHSTALGDLILCVLKEAAENYHRKLPAKNCSTEKQGSELFSSVKTPQRNRKVASFSALPIIGNPKPNMEDKMVLDSSDKLLALRFITNTV